MPVTQRRSATDSIARIRRDVESCVRCPRLVDHCRTIARVKRRAYRDEDYWGKPVPGFGDPKARVLILGLAPGAHGANRTGRMFTGDASGDWLYRALHETGFANQAASTARGDGLALTDLYITAAGRCAPPDNKPAPAELTACRPFLHREAAVLRRVRLVVALGGIAYDTYLRVVRESGGTPPRPKVRFGHEVLVRMDGSPPPGALSWPVLCSYHPSRQNTQTGRLSREMLRSVFERARAFVEDGAS